MRIVLQTVVSTDAWTIFMIVEKWHRCGLEWSVKTPRGSVEEAQWTLHECSAEAIVKPQVAYGMWKVIEVEAP